MSRVLGWASDRTIHGGAAFAVAPVAVHGTNWLPAIGFVAAAALVVGMIRSKDPAPSVRWSALGSLPALLIALVLWASLSAVWATVPQDSLSTALKLLLVAVSAVILLRGALSLQPSERFSVGTSLLLGYLIGLALLGFELVSDGVIIRLLRGLEPEQQASHYFARAATVFSLFVFPVGLVVWRRFGWVWALLIYGLTLTIVAHFTSTSSTLALACGGAMLAMAALLPRVAGWALGATIAVMVAVTPFMAVVAPATKTALTDAGVTSISVLHRLVIWGYVGEEAAERPILGLGLDTSRHLEGSNKFAEVVTLSDGNAAVGQLITLHPHNGLLQVWLELGVPGILIVGALLLLAVRWVLRNLEDRRSLGVCFALMTTSLVVMQISYGIWQGWWQSALWLAAGITLAVSAQSPVRQDVADTERRAEYSQ